MGLGRPMRWNSLIIVWRKERTRRGKGKGKERERRGRKAGVCVGNSKQHTAHSTQRIVLTTHNTQHTAHSTQRITTHTHTHTHDVFSSSHLNRFRVVVRVDGEVREGARRVVVHAVVRRAVRREDQFVVSDGGQQDL